MPNAKKIAEELVNKILTNRKQFRFQERVVSVDGYRWRDIEGDSLIGAFRDIIAPQLIDAEKLAEYLVGHSTMDILPNVDGNLVDILTAAIEQFRESEE